LLAIVNTDLNWAIGKEGDLQVRISDDLKRFKELTIGKVIIYGSKTLDTYPNRKVLPNRLNIILTRQEDLSVDNAIICHSIAELNDKINQLKAEKNYEDHDFIVVGGESVYSQLLPETDLCYVTKMQVELEADAYFPNLDKLDEWKLESESKKYFDDKSGISYSYLVYRRKK